MSRESLPIPDWIMLYIKAFRSFDTHGGDMVSTWAVKLQEHAEADEVLVKTFNLIFGNDYQQLAA